MAPRMVCLYRTLTSRQVRKKSNSRYRHSSRRSMRRHPGVCSMTTTGRGTGGQCSPDPDSEIGAALAPSIGSIAILMTPPSLCGQRARTSACRSPTTPELGRIRVTSVKVMDRSRNRQKAKKTGPNRGAGYRVTTLSPARFRREGKREIRRQTGLPPTSTAQYHRLGLEFAPVSRMLGLGQEAEHDHRHKGLKDRPRRAQHRLLVPHLHVTPGEIVE